MQSATTSKTSGPYRIVIAVAFDATTHHVLREGFRLSGRRSGCELHAVHAVSDSGSVADTEQRMIDATEELNEHLEALWGEAAERRVMGHIRAGKPVDTILQVAVDVNADLLVVGTHQRAGIERLLVGSTAESVLHKACCPVLVALPKDYRGEAQTPGIEPPCNECLVTRALGDHAPYWCERHSKRYAAPHLYVPRDEGRNSLMPTY